MHVSMAALVLSAAAVVATAPAQAETLKFLTNQNQQTLSGGTEIVLDGASGATVVKFKLDKPAIVVVTFTASCFAEGNPGSGANAVIAVKLNGRGQFKALPPSLDLPMCRVYPSGAVAETTSIVGGMEMPEGTHRIRVNASTLNFATARFGATALRIEK